MTCYNCWYAASVKMQEGVSVGYIECWNQKSDYFAKEVDRSFECSLFSDSSRPDPEAKKIVLDPKLATIVRRKRDEFARAHNLDRDRGPEAA